MGAIGSDFRIFEAKFRIPSAAKDVLRRPRLNAQLDGAAECKLIAVSAPAGFGKTTLVASWLHNPGGSPPSIQISEHGVIHHKAWLSLDEREDRLPAFVGHLIGAIHYVAPHLRFSAADMLQLPAYPPVADIARALISDIVAGGEAVTLVLDDYHLIHEAEIHSLVELLLAYSPDYFRLIVISLDDPPLPIARLCLQGRARQLRAAELRFRPEEATEFLRQALPADVTLETIAAVANQAAGWIAQLRLAAVLLQQASDQTSPESIQNLAVDYLMEELLANESPEVVAFLLATSVLERFSAPLAEALLEPHSQDVALECASIATGNGRRPAQILKSVVQAGLFVSELDTARTWYRYHDLFRELLLQRLRRDCPNDVLVLRRRAYEWLKKSGFVEEALVQAQAMDDTEALIDLVDQRILGAIQDYQWQTAQRWLDMLPPEAARMRPALLLARGMMLANAGASSQLRRVIQWAEAALTDPHLVQSVEQRSIWSGTLDLLRSEYARQRRTRSAKAWTPLAELSRQFPARTVLNDPSSPFV